MAHKIIPRLREPITISSDFTGEKPTLLFQAPILEFHPFETAPTYTQQQVTLPGKDKATAIGKQRLRKRAAADPTEQPAIEAQQHLSIHSNDLLELADSYLKQRDYLAALKFYELSKNDPAHFQKALYRKSKCCWMLGRLVEAKECLDSLLKFYPDDAQAWARRGAILIQQHEYPEALANLKHGFALSKNPQHLVEYTVLFDCYDSFANATDTTAFHLQHISYDLKGNPLVSEDDLHLLRGIFFASRQNYTSALKELSFADQKPSNSLEKHTLQIVQNLRKRKGHIAGQPTGSVTLQARRVPISALLNND